jgi:trimethylamine---corrinoid protein Co-methyltransferase
VNLSTFKVLSDSEVLQIHEASLDILENCGVKIGSPQVFSFLQAKGFPVDTGRQIVRFPRSAVAEALSHAPAQFEVYDREGKFAFVLGDGKSKIAAGHNAVFWVDSETGETRYSTVQDVELFARLCDALEFIHMIGIPVMPQDVPNPRNTLPYAVRAVIKNSRKPVFFSTDNARINRVIINLAEAGFAGDFRNQVYGISQLSPTSPLFWEEGVLEAILDTVQTAVPLAILPEPNAGLSCPYTLAGLLTVNNAECVSGLAIIQMLKPGAKVLYANSWTVTDMRGATALVGSTETTICRVAGAQLARFYHLPGHTTAPNSDNHAHDEQNAWEKTFSMFCSVGAGNDLIVNCGMFATGMTCSHEQLIMDEEISAMSKRIAEGVLVTPDTLATDLIKQIGPRGDYMLTEHTLSRLRGGEFLRPRVSVRTSRASWEAAGCKDTYQMARDEVRRLSKTAGSPLDPIRAAKLDEIIQGLD